MIIECEKCESKFNLDESLLRPGGSRVRCSVCKQVFLVNPPPSVKEAEEASDASMAELGETVALDSPPVLEKAVPSPPEEPHGIDFEDTFKDALLDERPIPLSIDQLPDEEEEGVEAGKAMGRAAEVEREVTRKGFDKRISDMPPQREEQVPKPAPKKPKRRFRLLPIFVVLLVVVVGGFLGVYFLAPGMLPDSLSFLRPSERQDVMDTGVARLSFKGVKGSFVQSEKTGQLFVIQGMITNNYPKGRNFILVKGALLDDKGKAVKTKMAYAGNTFTEDQLKTLTLEEIDKESKNRFGQNKRNINIKPEASVPFMIVIGELPENLSEFTVEAVSSFPEQQ